MPNVIDELGAKVVGNRYKGEDDQEYATRVLDRLYRSWQTINASGWTGDQETHEYQLHADTGAAYIARGRDKHNQPQWLYCVYRSNYCGKGMSSLVSVGSARYLEKAMQICSLVLA